jgi:hypothetical protein
MPSVMVLWAVRAPLGHTGASWEIAGHRRIGRCFRMTTGAGQIAATGNGQVPGTGVAHRHPGHRAPRLRPVRVGLYHDDNDPSFRRPAALNGVLALLTDLRDRSLTRVGADLTAAPRRRALARRFR